MLRSYATSNFICHFNFRFFSSPLGCWFFFWGNLKLFTRKFKSAKRTLRGPGLEIKIAYVLTRNTIFAVTREARVKHWEFTRHFFQNLNMTFCSRLPFHYCYNAHNFSCQSGKPGPFQIPFTYYLSCRSEKLVLGKSDLVCIIFLTISITINQPIRDSNFTVSCQYARRYGVIIFYDTMTCDEGWYSSLSCFNTKISNVY